MIATATNIQQYTLLNNIDDFSSAEMIEMLKYADDQYFNNSPVLSDEEYDTLKYYAQQNDPYNLYFEQVGVAVRTGKIKLPHQMGSLNQIYYGGDAIQWCKKHNLFDETLVCTDKLDGVSAMVVYDEKGNFKSSFSRGDGIEGANIDRHTTKLSNFPLKVSESDLVVRGEIIFSKQKFEQVVNQIKTRSGQQYKNARNCIAGLMNAEKNDISVYKFIDFVAYQIVNDTRSKTDQLLTLKDLGFNTPRYNIITGKQLQDEYLSHYVTDTKSTSEYELDGIVIDVDSGALRQKINPTKETLNPEYSVKYKIVGADNQKNATVVGVEWSKSKHGYLKPVVVFDPINLGGVTISRATGFNAAFIWNNKIGKDAVVNISRNGDVIPYINFVVNQSLPSMPEGNWEWNETGVDIILINPEEHSDVLINRLVDFFSTLSVSHMKEGNVTELFNNGFDTAEKIINMQESQLVSILGSNGSKVYESISEKLTNVPLYMLMGAYSTARGIGTRKIKKLQKEFNERLLSIKSINDIINVEGFDVKTANQVLKCIEMFVPFLEQISSRVVVNYNTNNSSGEFTGKSIVFTGFRDSNLENTIEQQGGNVSSGVSKKTSLVVAKDITENSSKIQKANQLGIPVVSLETFLIQIDELN